MATKKQVAAKPAKNAKQPVKSGKKSAVAIKAAASKNAKKATPAKKVANSNAKKPVAKKVAAPKKAPAKVTAKKAAPVKKAAPAGKSLTKNISKTVNKKTSKTVTTKKATTVKKSAPVKKAAPVSKKEAPAKKAAVKEAPVKVAPKSAAKPEVKKPATKQAAVPAAKTPVKAAASAAKPLPKNLPGLKSLQTATAKPAPSPAPRQAEPKKPGIIVAHRRLENKSKNGAEPAGKTMVSYQPEAYRSILDEPQQQTGPVYRYSDEELNEFKDLITGRLEAARKELVYLQGLITRKDEAGTEDTENRYMNMEDGSGAMEREQLAQLASRQIQFINHLEKAMVRIENKTYGICRVTGKLIDKARLRAVPHATLSIEAKKYMANKQ